VNATEPLLVDASVWIAASNPKDAFHRAANEIAVNTSRRVAALDLTLYEVANVVGVREGRSGEVGFLLRLIVDRCARNLVRADADLLSGAVEFAEEHGLTSYDAAYVTAAERHGWTLVSLDIRDLVSKGLAVTPDGADYS
jgi:predicted nucleic acid-binding protein